MVKYILTSAIPITMHKIKKENTSAIAFCLVREKFQLQPSEEPWLEIPCLPSLPAIIFMENKVYYWAAKIIMNM